MRKIITECPDLWQITAITDHEGIPRIDGKRERWVGQVIMFTRLVEGEIFFADHILEADGSLYDGFIIGNTFISVVYMHSSPILSINTADDCKRLTVKTVNNSIYYFQRYEKSIYV
jgi:hypothetical protein